MKALAAAWELVFWDNSGGRALFAVLLIAVQCTAVQFAPFAPIYRVPYLHKPIPLFPGELLNEHRAQIEREARLRREAEERAELQRPVLPKPARVPTKRDLLNDEIRNLTDSISLLNAIGPEKHAAAIRRMCETVEKQRQELKALRGK